ncbi:MAG TPA: hypothetical protein VFI25_10215 [Planctomycetota bacterium]|nr:hypothetical protein [Planctomycetota bacterium]
MPGKETKGKSVAAASENCDAVFAVFYEWLTARPGEEREAILRDGLPLRRIVEEIATRKEVTPRLVARGKSGPSPSAYAYAVSACLRRRDYFLFRDPAAKASLEEAGSDASACRREPVIDAVVLLNPVSKDARARGFPYASLLLDTAGVPPPASARTGGARVPTLGRAEEPGESEEEDALDEDAPTASLTPSALRARPGSERAPVRQLPAAFQTAAPGWQGRSTRALEAPETRTPFFRGEPERSPARPWEPHERRSGFESARGGAHGFTGSEGRERGRRSSPSPAPVPPPPPLPARTPEELIADYLASSVGPPLVNIAQTPDGRPRYAGWAADFGREVAPGKRSLDLRSERDLVALLFLEAAASLSGGYRSAVDLLSGLFEANLVTMSFWRDEGTLLKVGAPKRIPVPQPLQIALHVMARNEGEIREALRFEEILAGRKPALDVERVYRTLMSEKMELPRYWRGPFKRNRRHRKLLPSRLGRVLVVRIPTLLRELHLQRVVEVDPAECCAADKPVRRALYAAGIRVRKPVNRMLSLRENSRAIHERFGELFEMPLLLYGRTWRRQ